MYQDRLGELEGKSDKFVQKFNELLDFTDHADRVFQTSGLHQKRTLMKLCFEGFIVRNQKLTPLWTPVFDVLMDLQVSKIEPPKPSQGSKSLANSTVQTWKSGGPSRARTVVGQALFDGIATFYTIETTRLERIKKLQK
jgi:hypothetical protein